MDLNTLHARCVETWAERVNAVADGQWDDPTPCAGWSVRDLVNHVAGEDLWTTPLMRGSTIEEVGDRFDGDVLGTHPVAAALVAAREATTVVAELLPTDGTVHLSYGEERMAEYVHQLAADHLVHAWDLAVATGGDRRLDPALVHDVATWFAGREELYRGAGIIGERRAAGAGHGDAQSVLLGAFGRDPEWGPNHALLASFSAAFGRGDVAAIDALTHDDCVFESTAPPDGDRVEGAAALREVWRGLFEGTPGASFTEEASFVCGDRGVLQWRYGWEGEDGAPGHVRGVDVLRFRDGKVVAKQSYVKG